MLDPESTSRRAGAADVVITFCRTQALVYRQASLTDLLAGPFQSVVRKDPAAIALCRTAVVAHWRYRWCDAVLLVEDGTLAVARAEPIGKVACEVSQCRRTLSGVVGCRDSVTAKENCTAVQGGRAV